MTSSPWTVFAVGLVVKAGIVIFSNELRQGLMFAGLTTFVELLPALATYRHDRQASVVRTYGEFGRGGDSLVPLGSLLMLASISFGFFVTAAILDSLPDGALGAPESLSLQVPGLPALGVGDTILFICVAPLAFVVGRWMGRSQRPNASVAQGAGSVAAAHICGMWIPMILVLTMVGVDGVLPKSQAVVSTLVLVLSLCVALYGQRRGHKQVLGAYVAHLLDRASTHDQEEILELAYERAAAHQARGSQKIISLFGR